MQRGGSHDQTCITTVEPDVGEHTRGLLQQLSGDQRTDACLPMDAVHK